MLMGDTTFGGYAKISVPDHVLEKVYLQTSDRILDVSGRHWVVCIDPFVFGIWIERNEVDPATGNHSYCHIYITSASEGDGRQMIKKAEVRAQLALVDAIREDKGSLLLFELKKTNIYQLNFVKRFLIYYRYYKQPGLPFSRFKSFTAAYSYPRQVSIISFRQGDYYNIFPMDLLGAIHMHQRFVFGLQCKNVTLPKILETRRLVVSEVSYEYKETIYQLGRHHSGHPPSLKSLPFDVITTENFKFYIPDWAESYREIHILQTRKLGSHMLLWGEIIAARNLTAPVSHLSTVHFLHFLHQKNRGNYYTEA